MDNKLSRCKSYVITSLVKKGYENNEAKSIFDILAMHFLNKSKVDILVNPDVRLTEGDLLLFNGALKRLLKKEPVQYIIGKTEFYGREFKVTPDVLIPRSETEELVDWIINDEVSTQEVDVLDIGTGSACIAISLDLELSKSNVIGIDISEPALSVAKENNILLKAKVKFEQADIITLNPSSEQYDIIVSNPPYVLNSERDDMEVRVKDNEPEIALFVEDNDPLVFYNVIAKYAKIALRKEGKLYFEINQYLAEDTINLLVNLGYNNVELRKDLNGNNRMIRAII